MTSTPDYVEILARIMSEASEETWETIDGWVQNLYRNDARDAITKFEEAGFVIMPKRATDGALRVIYDYRSGTMSASRFYETIINAEQNDVCSG